MSSCLGKIQNGAFLDHIGHGNFRFHKNKSMENSNPGKLCVSLSMISTKWSATLLSNTKKRHAAVSSEQTPAVYNAAFWQVFVRYDNLNFSANKQDPSSFLTHLICHLISCMMKFQKSYRTKICKNGALCTPAVEIFRVLFRAIYTRRVGSSSWRVTI